MRYRRLDENGDMTFGQGQGNFYINEPEAVAQLVLTRLRLDLGAWFYDITDGTAWQTEVLGERTRQTRDIVVIDRVRDTVGVSDIETYGSRFDPNERTWTAAMKVMTIFGPISLVAPRLPTVTPPALPPPPVPTQLFPATELGVLGGTPQTMTPADLTAGPRANITRFSVTRMAGGSW